MPNPIPSYGGLTATVSSNRILCADRDLPRKWVVDMLLGLIIAVAVLITLDLLAIAAGADTRDGRDWTIPGR
jgi:hypothetical protein